MKLGIVGLGLMGGSMGLAAKQKGLADKVYGFDLNPTHNKEAVELGLVDELLSKEALIEKSDMIILAVNMDALQAELVWFLDRIKPHQSLVDLGSTKYDLAASVKKHQNRSCYIAAHPIAGTEYSGPKSALADLYAGKSMILCDLDISKADKVKQVKDFFIALEMHCVAMNSIDHDLHIAYTSHLSHIVAFALSGSVLEKEKMHDNLLNLAGSGFASTVRLAKSSPEMWVPIFKHNKINLLNAIDSFEAEVKTLKNLIEQENWEELKAQLKNANNIKKILD